MNTTKTTLFWEVTETVNGTNKVASGNTTVDGDRNRVMAHWDVYFAHHGYRLIRVGVAA